MSPNHWFMGYPSTPRWPSWGRVSIKPERRNLGRQTWRELPLPMWVSRQLIIDVFIIPSTDEELSSLRTKRSLRPWLWWCFHRCILLSKLINLHILNIQLFVYQSYINKVVKKKRFKEKTFDLQLTGSSTHVLGTPFGLEIWDRNWWNN